MNYNINFLVSELLVETLVKVGLKHVCMSPGSRNTPVTLAFARNENIDKKVFVDERSSAFFALGMAKVTGLPVAVVCTSGTAAAEMYPAIVEAYTAQIPLIVITADRPEYLKNTGSNQTINQTNIYSANCDHFFDPGLPETSLFYLQGIVEMTKTAFLSTLSPSKGPVHINLPFEKPLEPSSYNCEVTKSELNSLHSLVNFSVNLKSDSIKDEYKTTDQIGLIPDHKVLIILANKHYDVEFLEKIIHFSGDQNIPVCLEATLNVRASLKEKFIQNLGNMLQSQKFVDQFNPDKIIIFGRNPVSKNLERYLNRCKVSLFVVNTKGENFGKASSNKTVLKMDENEFIGTLLTLEKNFSKLRIDFNQMIQKSDEIYSKELIASFKKDSLDSEVETMALLASMVSDNPDIPVFISNSLPIRDYDFLKQFFPNPVYSNRGASGIDGIISTSAGIATAYKTTAVLVIGDLSFHYDSNALQFIKKHQIPLLIILINNSGGSIFEYLPIYSESEEFDTYFKAETEIDFGSLVKAYGLKYYGVDSVLSFKNCINNFFDKPEPTVLKLKFDSTISREKKDGIKDEIRAVFEKNL